MAIANESLTTLDSGENSLHCLISAASYFWATTITVPTKLIKFDPSALTHSTLTFANDGNHKRSGDVIYIASKGKLYAIMQTTTHPLIVLSEIDPTNLTTTDVISETASGYRNDASNSGSLTTDGTYVYMTGYNTFLAGYILKYDIATWTFQSAVAAGGIPHCVRYDSVSSKLYVTTLAAPAHILRIDPSTMTVEDDQAFTADNATDDFAFWGDYIFVGFEGTTQVGQLCKVLKSDLTDQTYIDPGVGTACFAAYYDGIDYIWAVFNSTPGVLARITPDTLAVKTYTFATGQNAPNEILYVAPNMWFTFNLSPAQISSANYVRELRQFYLLCS